MAKTSTLLYSLKILLIVTGLLVSAVILRVFVPVLVEYLAYEVPVLWSSFRSWLTPPYLYVVINFIILTIAVSSRFQNNLEQKQQELHTKPSIVTPVVKVSLDVASSNFMHVTNDYGHVQVKNSVHMPDSVMEPYSTQSDIVVYEEDKKVVEFYSQPNPMVFEEKKVTEFYSQPTNSVLEVEKKITPEDDLKELSKPAGSLNRYDSVEFPAEYSADRPPIFGRFGNRKSTSKGNPEARKAPRVAKPKRQETLENTWKTITEGRQMPLARHLKKSETWDRQGRQLNMDVQDLTSTKMQKSETFTDKISTTTANSSLSRSQALTKLKKDPSLSQDELNRKVEEFIKKFNEDMRLQRQESLKKYMEMVKGGGN